MADQFHFHSGQVQLPLHRLVGQVEADDLAQRQQVRPAQVHVAVGRGETVQVRPADRDEQRRERCASTRGRSASRSSIDPPPSCPDQEFVYPPIVGLLGQRGLPVRLLKLTVQFQRPSLACSNDNAPD